MTWLLKLYPPRWRRRYGDEFRALVGTRRLSVGDSIDVISGAIDAWIHPQMNAAAQPLAAKGEEKMREPDMRLRCAGYGPAITKADQWKSASLMLAMTLILTAAWVWLHVRTHDNAYVDAFSLMPLMSAWLLSMRYTYLKARSGLAQAIFIGGTLALLAVIFGLAGWITSRM
jgi:hypothetical protein